jgi:hypothetical protein
LVTVGEEIWSTAGEKSGEVTPHNSKLNCAVRDVTPSEDHGDKLSTREPKVSKGNEQVEIDFNDQ